VQPRRPPWKMGDSQFGLLKPERVGLASRTRERRGSRCLSRGRRLSRRGPGGSRLTADLRLGAGSGLLSIGGYGSRERTHASYSCS
jgi:hypothetical protein